MVKVEIKCPFKSDRCLCQWCEDQCNNGLNCHNCNHAKEQMHDTYMCTGFTGMYPWGTHSDEIRAKAQELIEEREKKRA